MFHILFMVHSHWLRYRLQLTCTATNSIYYRPQTKFAKVMFLQVSVCPHGGRGHAWFFLGGMHGFFRAAYIGYDEIRSMSGRYASYWNAFLLSVQKVGQWEHVHINIHNHNHFNRRIINRCEHTINDTCVQSGIHEHNSRKSTHKKQ